ncbi:hypothetical protein [Tritonibacter scottomollicae]|uniref:Muramidase (Phage lysozyme) n=1 Tax=Tritonibacter scottomollicae TaxID=483013 RepID=A0A2T1AHD8_TRISK|nr:hypothetical protein [Tritonibacter scottomollicae]PRZ48009.1 muramidase (phage lysozyme) [Tritonibacter scottomollicae]
MGSRGALAVLGAGVVVATYAAWRDTKQKNSEQQAIIQPAVYQTGGSKAKLAAMQGGGGQGGDLKSALVGWGVDTLFGAIERGGWMGGGWLGGGNNSPGVGTGSGIDRPPGTANTNSPPASSGGKGLGGLLDLIGSVEAPKGYDQVYGGSKINPPQPITSMTVAEVLDWQDRSVAAGSASSAAGKYQVIRGTLRDEVRNGTVSMNDRFTPAVQDKIAVSRMNYRGLGSYQAGLIDETEFGQRLSMEWASLPALKTDRNGRAARGQSYYAGDGLNKSHVTPDTILSKLKGLF